MIEKDNSSDDAVFLMCVTKHREKEKEEEENGPNNACFTNNNNHINDDEQEKKVLEGSAFPRFDTWWQWWLPHWMWGEDKSSTENLFSRYRMDHRAFAGGSHGDAE